MVIAITIVGASSFVACANSASYSNELVCGELVFDDSSQVFVSGSCDTDHTAERFFAFEAPFEDYNQDDIVAATSEYCFFRFLAHYDLHGDGVWGSGEFSFVGVAPDIEEWNQGNNEIACVAYWTDGSIFP